MPIDVDEAMKKLYEIFGKEKKRLNDDADEVYEDEEKVEADKKEGRARKKKRQEREEKERKRRKSLLVPESGA